MNTLLAAPLLAQTVDWVRFSVWLTPIWLLGVGALLGLLILLALWGLLYLVSRRYGSEVPLAVREGPLGPIFVATASLAAFAVVGYPVAASPGELLGSLMRLPTASTLYYEFDLQGSPADALTGNPLDVPPQAVEVNFRSDEVQSLRFESNRPVAISSTEKAGLTSGGLLELSPGEEEQWRRGSAANAPFSTDADVVRKLYVRNLSEGPGTLQLVVETAPAYAAQVSVVPITALAVAGVFLLYFVHRLLMPRLSAIALATVKTEMNQSIFWVILGLGSFSLVAFHFVPYYTLGDDIIMFKNSSLSLILVLCVFQAVWAASQSVAEEVEGRTALTVLSKPVARLQFITGKFLGISWTVAVVLIVLGLVLLLVVAHKPIYDARESSQETPLWQQTHLEVVQLIPGLFLVYLETIVMASISVAISTRLPMLANFMISLTIYVMGHLTPLLVQSSVVTEQFEPVVFIGRLISTVLPVLEYFNIQAGIAGGAMVPWEYLGMALAYCILYSTMAMLLSLVLFEDRDLA